jgi:hypothetical protein
LIALKIEDFAMPVAFAAVPNVNVAMVRAVPGWWWCAQRLRRNG